MTSFARVHAGSFGRRARRARPPAWLVMVGVASITAGMGLSLVVGRLTAAVRRPRLRHALASAAGTVWPAGVTRQEVR